MKNILLLLHLVVAKKFIIQFNSHEDAEVHSNTFSHSKLHKNTILVDCDIIDLNSIKGVKYIEEDFEIKHAAIQIDPVWNLAKLSNSSKEYDYPSLISDTNVYIIDTGIDISHPEFEGRASWGNNFLDENDVDCNGHGTHVAGITGSKTYGVHKLANMIAVKVLGCDGLGTNSGILNAVSWVVEQHKKDKCKRSVINMSLAGTTKSQILQELITEAVSIGIIVVVAAGNAAVDACDVYPSGYSGVITVGATDDKDGFAFFSNKGKCIDILAPGQSIVSTFPGGITHNLSGTSMASPHVAGVASLMFSYCNYTAQQIIDKIKEVSRKNIITGVPSGTINDMLFSDGNAVDCPVLRCGETTTYNIQPTGILESGSCVLSTSCILLLSLFILYL